MDGGIHTEKRDDQTYRVECRSGEFRAGHRGASSGLGEVVKYSYRMVYTQESIRLLDLRLDIAELENLENLPELLSDAAVVFFNHALVGLIEDLGEKESLK